MRTCPAPWGMSAQEHTFTFCQIFFISGGNYTLITCIQYTTMVTHSDCEISQSWRTQFSSHGALNLNRAVMPPLPLSLLNCFISYITHSAMNMFAGKQLYDLYTHAIHIHNSQLASSLSSSTVYSVVLECPATSLSKHDLSSNRH